jgi:mTERF domain-containing protein
MFRKAMQAVAFLSDKKIAIKLGYLKNMLKWSDAEVSVAVCKAPMLLVRSKDALQRKLEFLISEVGLEPAYIAHRPALLSYSLEGRVRPRYYVLKLLKEKGLVHQDRDFYNTVMIAEKLFMERFICPHKEAAPHLAQDYAAACRGEVPTRFSFT